MKKDDVLTLLSSINKVNMPSNIFPINKVVCPESSLPILPDIHILVSQHFLLLSLLNNLNILKVSFLQILCRLLYLSFVIMILIKINKMKTKIFLSLWHLSLVNIYLFIYFVLIVQVQLSPFSSLKLLPPQPSPPPTLHPTPLWFCPCVLHTCS